MKKVSRFSKVFVKIWHSKDFQSLSEDGKLMFLYLLTSPHRNMGGYYSIPIAYLCYDLNFEEKRVKKALNELNHKQMVIYDYNTQIVLILKWFLYNPIENINQAKGLNRQLAELPVSNLLGIFAECVEKYCDYKEIILKELPVPLKDAEQNSFTNILETPLELETETKLPPTPYEKIKELYNTLCPSFPRIEIISENRKKHLRARWKQYNGDLSVFEKLFIKTQESNFLRGNNDRGWKPDFDWLINETNMAKVLEGKYDNKENRDPAWQSYGKNHKTVEVNTDKIIENVFRSLEVEDGSTIKK
ncbi:MAG: hypothetical protein NC925_05105 [Candidatus Omnitrophica bacterium]|nr:hypothetical protein [Candidatus Omnitrophota bacterium]